MILTILLLVLPNVVSANRRVCAIFSITLPAVVKSDKCGFLAALCLRARVRRAYMEKNKNLFKFIFMLKIGKSFKSVIDQNDFLPSILIKLI